MSTAQNNETTPNQPNPFYDIRSVDIECQIQNSLESALDVCDLRIHYKQPTTPQEIEATLWNIRLLVESALSKYNFMVFQTPPSV